MTTCSHCSGLCLLKAHVRDGVIVRIGTTEGTMGAPGLRGCARGRALRQRIYAPDRLRFPLKRDGERGEGRFKQISWNEALDTIVRELIRVKGQHGPTGLFYVGGGGSNGRLHATLEGPAERLLNMFGGCTGRRGQMSWGGVTAASLYSYGTTDAGNDSEDLINSRFILLWSFNPAETVSGPYTRFNLTLARERGIRIVLVDPRYTDTAAAYADEWIPLRPGSDGAFLAAVAYVILSEGLQDQPFLDRYVQGFEVFRDYLQGREDGRPKTPEWASPICGVPAEQIASLAREYATAKPAALVPGGGYQRTAIGEQPSRLCIALATLTGNVGRPGGNAAGHYMTKSYARHPIGKLPIGDNPTGITIAINKWADAVLEGTAGGYESDIKLLYVGGRNLLNQFGNVGKSIQAMRKLEFIVVQEQFMTPTARYADIVLPVTTWLERNDIMVGRQYAVYSPRIIEPMYQCKSDLQICTELAERLCIEGYNDRTEEEWLRGFCEGSDIEDFQRFQREGVFYFEKPEPYVAFRNQIEDPVHHPFETPSGKIELYSPRLAELNQPETIPPIPKYIRPWESPEDPLSDRFPLQLITPHCKKSTHSTHANVPWLQEMESHRLWINPADSASRGIADGELVRVFNLRGELYIPARVTERIRPGVVSLDEGSWYQPNDRGIDLGGCPNVLTRDEDTPLGDGATVHSCLVQVGKI